MCHVGDMLISSFKDIRYKDMRFKDCPWSACPWPAWPWTGLSLNQQPTYYCRSTSTAFVRRVEGTSYDRPPQQTRTPLTSTFVDVAVSRCSGPGYHCTGYRRPSSQLSAGTCTLADFTRVPRTLPTVYIVANFTDNCRSARLTANKLFSSTAFNVGQTELPCLLNGFNWVTERKQSRTYVSWPNSDKHHTSIATRRPSSQVNGHGSLLQCGSFLSVLDMTIWGN